MRRRATPALWLIVLMTIGLMACNRNPKPVARPTPPPADNNAVVPTPGPPAPPEPVREPVVVPPEPVRADTITSSSLDDLNKQGLLKPVFFEYDSSELTQPGIATLNENASTMKRNGSWTVTIEGHCDERGTAEYNLALGERRAVAARTYLLSLGVSADKLRTVSYGKEFPFDPGHDESAYTKNRRAHFVITAK